jgi:hypothetical protein
MAVVGLMELALELLRHKLRKSANDAALRVTRGLDPRVHLLRKKMDCRVKPGDNAEYYDAVVLACGDGPRRILRHAAGPLRSFTLGRTG